MPPIFIPLPPEHCTEKIKGSQRQKVKFQDLVFNKFQNIFSSLKRLNTKKVYTFLCAEISHADQYCSPKHVTKAMLHMEHGNVSR